MMGSRRRTASEVPSTRDDAGQTSWRNVEQSQDCGDNPSGSGIAQVLAAKGCSTPRYRKGA